MDVSYSCFTCAVRCSRHAQSVDVETPIISQISLMAYILWPPAAVVAAQIVIIMLLHRLVPTMLVWGLSGLKNCRRNHRLTNRPSISVPSSEPHLPCSAGMPNPRNPNSPRLSLPNGKKNETAINAIWPNDPVSRFRKAAPGACPPSKTWMAIAAKAIAPGRKSATSHVYQGARTRTMRRKKFIRPSRPPASGAIIKAVSRGTKKRYAGWPPIVQGVQPRSNVRSA